ncbi:MAG: hypothetical protein UY45_C0005G0002 [Parcubacteria group bacterium GW2011_GWA1_49_26]|uniref:Uncharacterized protein n=1 Tax=Candidatus Yanofskybacteria bacterium GW2011_GWC1_48_11 TaxID=1619027 RepID=A0A837INM3_9BACT|nr:MAG: hypothetical protein UY25_C0004G0096 [Candidatus Yanofskybacteria bacterium GW2011_GWC1_48_11]KKW04471.1 MAG: hypothetical protein UY38_C0001G0038 [Parcubacteria group bacterium GW2011_GWB1_49_12]KKW08599.1 MAG: hypothetical protein UY45_C0005G0002 [Parcubacteria group bacterium GW2011_GWA1_49_26]
MVRIFWTIFLTVLILFLILSILDILIFTLYVASAVSLMVIPAYLLYRTIRWFIRRR